MERKQINNQQTTTVCNNNEKSTYLTKYEQFISKFLSNPYNSVGDFSGNKRKKPTDKSTSSIPELTPQNTKNPKLETKTTPNRTDNIPGTLPLSNVPVSQKTTQPNIAPKVDQNFLEKNLAMDKVKNGNKVESLPPPEELSSENDSISSEELVTVLEDEPMTAYECGICSFETIYESSFKEHMLTHKKTRKDTYHKCPKCPFIIKCKANVRKHMVGDSDNAVYCGLYSYSKECNVDLDEHLREHKSDSN